MPRNSVCPSKWSGWEMGSIWERIGKRCVCILKEMFSTFVLNLLLPKITEPELILFLFPGEVKCESPNNKLDRFTGILTYKGKNYILNHDKLLLRGCIIRNTDWCYGLVIYTGTSGVPVRSPASWMQFMAKFWVLKFQDVDSTQIHIRTLWLWETDRKGDGWMDDLRKKVLTYAPQCSWQHNLQ